MIAWIRVLAAGAALALLAVSPALAVSSYSNLYVFGGSLVDNGRFGSGPVASDTSSLLAIGLLVLALRRSGTR